LGRGDAEGLQGQLHFAAKAIRGALQIQDCFFPGAAKGFQLFDFRLQFFRQGPSHPNIEMHVPEEDERIENPRA
jgi:hypothetical protein